MSGSVVDRIIKAKKQLAVNMVILSRHNGFSDPWHMDWDLYRDTIAAVDAVIAMEKK